ncbi:hypothetical protein L6452_08995 [Arctium lappa]|uniref:Uncharacterized protein n=1 Tax=Arctium lappa TaxID=4217 RepID=A0ACB9DJY8_ARCLA|nr:hypothetical protein L6452_08995 [Arctium lappa]
MEKSSPMKTPMSTTLKLHSDPDGKDVNVTIYRGMIGSLMYLMASRPDIMFSTFLCARFQSKPKESHLVAVKRIFRYLKGTVDLGLWYPKETGFELTAYSDVDHAGNMLDRKSTSGHVQFFGDRLVSWASKKQNCVATSTAEAEYFIRMFPKRSLRFVMDLHSDNVFRGSTLVRWLVSLTSPPSEEEQPNVISDHYRPAQAQARFGGLKTPIDPSFPHFSSSPSLSLLPGSLFDRTPNRPNTILFIFDRTGRLIDFKLFTVCIDRLLSPTMCASASSLPLSVPEVFTVDDSSSPGVSSDLGLRPGRTHHRSNVSSGRWLTPVETPSVECKHRSL